MSGSLNICLIGFGEVGRIFAEDLKQKASSIAAWDVLFHHPDSGPAKAAAGVRRGDDAKDAIRGASMVISVVTAGNALEAARTAANAVEPGAVYLDVNSVSPVTKKAIAKTINDAGGRFVEAVMMSPALPARLKTPMLLGGPHAQETAEILRSLGFAGATAFSPEIGKASAAKMCRSVLVKGLEALLTESLLTARHHGVEKTVIASLSDLFSNSNWEKHSRYMISRSLEHGARRAEEMREAAKTVEEAGLSPLMSTACAARLELASAFAYAAKHENLSGFLDAMLDGVRAGRPI